MRQSLIIKYTQLVLICGLGFGCTVEVGEEGSTGTVEQESNVSWITHNLSPLTVGMALSDGEGFQWLSDGIGCRSSTLSDPCGGTLFLYSVPGNNFAAIRGIGRAKNTGHIFAWYNDSTVTEGTASNFTAFSGGKNSFAPGLKPNRNAFSMDELVEVDNSDNGLWYYYWRDSSNNTFWRTTGASNNASSGAAQVTVSGAHGQIVGIAFGPGSPAPVETFYADGTLNISHTSLDIAN